MHLAVCSTTWAAAADGQSARSPAPGRRRPADSCPAATTAKVARSPAVTAAASGRLGSSPHCVPSHHRATTMPLAFHWLCVGERGDPPGGGSHQLPVHRQSIADERTHRRPALTTRIVGNVALAWSLRGYRRVSSAIRRPSGRQLAHIRHRRYRSG